MAETVLPRHVSLNEAIVSDTLANAQAAADETYSAISDLVASAASAGITMGEYVPGSFSSFVSESPVAYTDYTSFTHADEPVVGDVPALPDLSITLDPMPEMNFTRPTFNIPDPPNVQWPTFTEDPPSVTALDLPTAPSVTLPDPPSLDEIDIPAPPSAAVPEFSGTEPDIDLTPPSVSFAWTEDQYASALMTALTDRLESDLASGGEGLSSTIEQAIYDREESRKMDEEEDAYFSIMETGVGRGWMLPPGDVVGNILRLSDKISQDREDLNNTILKEQSALALLNTHHVIDTSVKVESVLIDAHNKVQQRSFEAAKFALTSAMEIYKVRAEAFKARVEVYAVLAKVYDAKIRAEIVKAELYKAHLEGLKVGVEVNRQRIQQYKAQLLGVKALVEMYKSEMQAGQVVAEVEKTRMQGFLARVEAYRGRIEAIQAEAEAYVYQVRGEVIKADMVKADANAYKAEMKAYESQAQVEMEEARAAIERLRAQIIVYNAQVEKYEADIDRSIDLGKADERLRGAQAQLRSLQSRYEAATIELDAAIHRASVTEASAQHRAKAIAHDAEQTAMVTTQRASATNLIASKEAATMVGVASAATETANTATTNRMIGGETSFDNVVERTGATTTSSVDVGFFTYNTTSN